MAPDIRELINAALLVADAHSPAAIRRLRAAVAKVEAGAERVQHVSRGSTYTLGPVIEMQVSTPGYRHTVNGRDYPIEGKHVQVYVCEASGKAWGRFVPEMGDGRYIELPAQQEKAA